MKDKNRIKERNLTKDINIQELDLFNECDTNLILLNIFAERIAIKTSRQFNKF